MNIKNNNLKKFNIIFKSLNNNYKDKIYLIIRKSISKQKKIQSFLGVLKKIYFKKVGSSINHRIDEIKFNKKKKQLSLFLKRFLTKIINNENVKKLNKRDLKSKNAKKKIIEILKIKL